MDGDTRNWILEYFVVLHFDRNFIIIILSSELNRYIGELNPRRSLRRTTKYIDILMLLFPRSRWLCVFCSCSIANMKSSPSVPQSGWILHAGRNVESPPCRGRVHRKEVRGAGVNSVLNRWWYIARHDDGDGVEDIVGVVVVLMTTSTQPPPMYSAKDG